MLGGNALYELPDHPGLTDAARGLALAFRTFDQEMSDAALGDISAGCESIEHPSSPAADGEGQIAYACALASTVRSDRGNPESWGSRTDDAAWHEVYAVVALIGAANGGTIAESDQLADAAIGLTLAARGTPSGVQSALDAFIEGCSA